MTEHPYPVYIGSDIKLLVPNMRWFVHEDYRIMEEEERTVGDNYNNQFFKSNTVPLTVYENLELDETIDSNIYFPPGKYICWLDQYKKSYNPFEESSNLLRKFLRLGHGNVPDRMVLYFSSRYGILKEIENQGTIRKEGFLYKKYPVDALKKYATEAYRVKNLHELLLKPDIGGVRKELMAVDDYIPGGFDSITNPFTDKTGFPLDFGEYIFSWWHKIPLPIRDHLLELMPPTDDIFSMAKAGQRVEDESNRIPSAFAMFSPTRDFWEAFISLAPSEMITDFAFLMISEILRLRLWEGITIKPQTVSSSSKPAIAKEYSVRPDSLLSAIWLMLYLEITSQEADYYQECEYCGEKNIKKTGEKIYRGNDFCDVNCRNNAYFHDVQGVVEMGRAGFPLGLIKKAYPRREEDSIIKWLQKEGIEVKELNPTTRLT